MTEKSIHQTLEPKDASDRVAEKAKLVTDRLAVVAKQTADERGLFPPAPAPKAAKKADG